MSKPTAAVVGSGVSGMTAAYLLSKRFEVTLFEARDRLGGNADTVEANGSPPIEAAFAEYNSALYPEVHRLLDELGVASKPGSNVTDVLCTDCGFTQADTWVGGQDLPARPERVSEATWQKFRDDRNAFGQLLVDSAKQGTDHGLTLGQMLARKGYGAYFTRHFLYPRLAGWYLGNAICLDDLPSDFLVQGLALLDESAYANWRTIIGGSRTYVEKIAAQLAAVHKAAPVRSVRRVAEGVEIHTADGQSHSFGKAVLATPAPETLRMLVDPDPMVQRTLGAFPYGRIEVYVHTDDSLLPTGFSPDSAIVLHIRCASAEPGTFHINAPRMHGLEAERPYYATYDPADSVAPEKVLHHGVYKHPTFTRESVAAQSRLGDLGDHVLAFAGSYHGDGLHEAGCRSGISAAAKLGVQRH
ncbi:FAD-dependent oxidoreductase [Streptomyces sp. NPDC054796]